MKSLRCPLALSMLLLTCAMGARAQFPTIFVPVAPPDNPLEPSSRQTASRLEARKKTDPLRYVGIGLYPLANFDTGGLFTQTGNAGTDNRFGGLISLDLGVVDQVTRTDKDTQKKYGEIHGRYEIGGWYWTTGNEDLYEMHLRAISEGGFGLQAGYLNSTKGFLPKPGPASLKTDATAYDFFVIYDLSSHHLIPLEKRQSKHYHPWNIEVGLGIYVDDATHYVNNFSVPSTRATANFTYFVQGSLLLTNRLSLSVSEWNFRDRYQDLNRVAVGLNYRF